MQLDTYLNRFRLASRDLFNQYFCISGSGSHEEAWLLVERFREIEEILFQKLVTEPASLTRKRYGDAQPEIIVGLRSGIDTAPVMMNRDVDSGYWDHPLTNVPRDAAMVFISFFDWDQIAYRDNQFVRMQVTSWPGHPEVTGKHVLLDFQNATFFRAARP
jgi:hypothetical protein